MVLAKPMGAMLLDCERELAEGEAVEPALHVHVLVKTTPGCCLASTALAKNDEQAYFWAGSRGSTL
eukprot:6466282-Amphidinium_carterae.1